METIQITNLIERIQECGEKTFELINTKSSQSVILPVFCNSRACSNPDCQTHRGNEFHKKHLVQIYGIQHSMQKPKAFVFTGWILSGNLNEHRQFICEKTSLLYHLLKRFSSTEFSLHCEVKPSKKYQGSFYVHWHVVMGGVKDFHWLRHEWGRQIKYETALSLHAVAKYVSKYASKTPVSFLSPDWLPYLQTTYKLRLHRFSTQQGVITKSDWIPLSVLLYELASAFKRARGSYPSGHGKSSFEHDFVPYLDKPPTPESDIPACVYIYPTSTHVKPTLKTHKTTSIHMGIIESASTYPKHYLCYSDMCSDSDGSGSLSKTKICSRCGGTCIE